MKTLLKNCLVLKGEDLVQKDILLNGEFIELIKDEIEEEDYKIIDVEKRFELLIF